MKKIFYIHILLMTVTCFITYTQQYNNSTAIVSQNGNGLMPSFNPYQGTQYNSPIFVAQHRYNTPRNRKERRAQGVSKHRSQCEAKKVTIDDEVERISKKIDEKILGIKGEGNCCSNLIDRLTKGVAYVTIAYKHKNGVIQILKIIDYIIQAEQDDSKVIIAQLAEKNGIFNSLINRLVSDDKWITGSNADRAFNLEFLFPFSDALYHFITNKKLSMNCPWIGRADRQNLYPISNYLRNKMVKEISSAAPAESWDMLICEEAFQNSMDDNEELDALLDSDVLKNVLEWSSFQKDLIQAINEQKEKNNNKKW